jgi:hypothetical protein
MRVQGHHSRTTATLLEGTFSGGPNCKTSGVPYQTATHGKRSFGDRGAWAQILACSRKSTAGSPLTVEMAPRPSGSWLNIPLGDEKLSMLFATIDLANSQVMTHSLMSWDCWNAEAHLSVGLSNASSADSCIACIACIGMMLFADF